ncbi:MAG: glycine--tRNA ligase [Planctomycetota bacterium]
MPAEAAFMDKLTALCKRRGFIYQSSEIYGGIGGFWDYGPMGVELKRNIKDTWWQDMVTNPPVGPDGREVEMVGVDCAIIMNPKVWEASGHATGFADPMVDCRECKARFRADQVWVMVWGDAGALEEPKDDASRAAYRYIQDELGKLGDDAAALSRADLVRRVNDVLAVSRRESIAEFKPLVKVVEATSSKEALEAAALSNRERKFFKQLAVGGLCTIDKYDGQYGAPTCPRCKALSSLTEPRTFNLMFRTHVGALEDAGSIAYLRPETAQGIFVNFKNVLDTTRVKLPFGIAQVGKSFRNEINPRNYTFRSREFEQMEIEFFCHAAQSMDWYAFWRKVRYDWYVNLGLKSEKLRLRDQGPEELAHYSKACADIEYLFPFSDEHQELEGVAHRGNFDLTQHAKFSGKDLTYFDDEAWERDRAARAAGPEGAWSKEQEKELKNKEPYRFLPTVIEPSAGADRAALAFLCEAYAEDQAPDENGVMQQRVLMRFHPRLAPIKVAVFPLVKKEGMPDIASAIYRDVKRHMTAFYDDKGAIGRRYRRQDEIGTPFCVTVDGDTLRDGTVTIRERDTLQQIRVPKEGVLAWLREHIHI